MHVTMKIQDIKHKHTQFTATGQCPIIVNVAITHSARPCFSISILHLHFPLVGFQPELRAILSVIYIDIAISR